ncbi:MAG: GHMP kinase [Bacteroidales bacterium]|nr:GHMP kinase [Bacteroidales bacterium]
MIITRTPFRVSFVGGGSDMETFYSRCQGMVLSTTINKYMYISSHRFFYPDQIRVKYSVTETVNSIDELKHPLIREAMRKVDVRGGVEFSSIADIPAGTGMGSSSAFTVGLLHCLYAIKRQYVTHDQLAKEAAEIEIDILGEPIGKQDQYATAFGGLNVIYFNPDGSVKVEPLYINTEVYNQLQENLVMFYLGNQRKASDILSEQKSNSGKEDKFRMLKSMVTLVEDLRNCLYSGKLDDFGRILDANWKLKQQLASNITNPEVDEIYKTGMGAGAGGGKLLGAGGGGFMLFYCEKPLQAGLIEKLKPLRTIDFNFEREGSKLIYFADEGI